MATSKISSKRVRSQKKGPLVYDPKSSRAFNLAQSAWAQMGIEITTEEGLAAICDRYQQFFDDLLEGKPIDQELLKEVKEFFRHISRDTLAKTQKRKRHWS